MNTHRRTPPSTVCVPVCVVVCFGSVLGSVLGSVHTLAECVEGVLRVFAVVCVAVCAKKHDDNPPPPTTTMSNSTHTQDTKQKIYPHTKEWKPSKYIKELLLGGTSMGWPWCDIGWIHHTQCMTNTTPSYIQHVHITTYTTRIEIYIRSSREQIRPETTALKEQASWQKNPDI